MNLRVFLHLILVVFFWGCATKNEIVGKVIKVIDGDSVVIVDSRNISYKVRLHGIDTPESKQSFGVEAKEFLKGKLNGKKVRALVKDMDNYNRYVSVILLGKEDINRLMVKSGYAWAYLHYSKDYEEDMKEAQAKKIGLWQEDNPQDPSEFRKNQKSKKAK